MVSFQCDGCSDVVKKPKLDQHGARCHAPFTCIDCSKTFRSPAEWKGHTTCISEAEKYQKALYKGPKGQKQNNGPGKFGNQPRTPGPGEYYGDNSGRGNRPRGAATGANTTPLATPTRMSPVSTPPPVAAPDPTPQKGDGVEVVNGVDGKKKKDKKRKSTVVDETLKSTEVRGNGDERPAKKAKTSADGVGKQAEVDPVTIPLPSSPEKDAEQVVSKKDKKDKKVKDKKKGKSEIRETKNGEEGKQVKERTEGSKKEKKQKRKHKSEIEDVEENKVEAEALKAVDVVAGADQPRDEEKRPKMDKKRKPKSEVDGGVSDGAEGEKIDKKRKKGESEAAGEVEKKKKKRPKLVEA